MNRDFLIPMNHIDIVPRFEIAGDFGMRYFVGCAQVSERLPGKHHAPAEGVVGSVAFIDDDVARGIGPFHEDGEIHAGRAAADDLDFHARSSSNAAPSRRTPSLNNSGSAHMPTRKCCGDSKKRPGTIAVSYFSASTADRSPTRPRRRRGNEVVPELVRTTCRSSRESKKSFNTARLLSRILFARAMNLGNFASAITLSRSDGCGPTAPNTSCNKRICCANSGSARIQPQRKPLNP